MRWGRNGRLGWGKYFSGISDKKYPPRQLGRRSSLEGLRHLLGKSEKSKWPRGLFCQCPRCLKTLQRVKMRRGRNGRLGWGKYFSDISDKKYPQGKLGHRNSLEGVRHLLGKSEISKWPRGLFCQCSRCLKTLQRVKMRWGRNGRLGWGKYFPDFFGYFG